MTPGSTNAYDPSSFATPKKKDITAAARSIFTSRSSNCFKMSFQKGFLGLQGSSLVPHIFLRRFTSLELRPSPGFARSWAKTCAENIEVHNAQTEICERRAERFFLQLADESRPTSAIVLACASSIGRKCVWRLKVTFVPSKVPSKVPSFARR